MTDLDKSTLHKVVGMFRPATADFFDFSKEGVVCGPNDRAMFGFDTYFPIEWLVKDFNFTEEEAKHFVNLVHGRKSIEC